MLNADTVYAQDCKSHRYQDQLKWGRFRTIMVIEGAMLIATAKRTTWDFDPDLLRVLLVAGLLLVVMLLILLLKDRSDANDFLNRIKAWEKSLPDCPKFTSGWPKSLRWLNGNTIVWAIGVIVTVLNGYLIYQV